MVSNFYHIKEKNVLIESHLDLKAKHKRNLVLAAWAIASVILFPFGLPHLCSEIHREMCIREINKKHTTLPYHKCVELVNMKGDKGVWHNGKTVLNPIDLKSPQQQRMFRLTKIAYDLSAVALLILGVVGTIFIMA